MNELVLGQVYRGLPCLPSEHEMIVFNTISKQAADSNLYKNYGGQPGIMMTILAARELGIPPMLALNGGIANIQGKLEISARLMNAMMRRAGIKLEIQESTDEKCVITGTRSDGDRATVEYTIEDAKKAGLVKPGGGWVKNPKDMCFARAISRLARQIAPDVIGGCYVEGEIRAREVEVAPEEIQPEIVDDGREEAAVFHELLSKFDKEDRFLVADYIFVVMEHFGWTRHETIKKFLLEKNLAEKFNSWKSKRKIAEQVENAS